METPNVPAIPEPQRYPVPTGNDLNAMVQVSQMLAKSSLVPDEYRNRPENILLATLAGQPFGWDPTMAMRSFNVIKGKPSLKPEIMLALVRRAGHSVNGETSPTGATVTGTRRDTGDTMTFSFTMDDAKRAGLLGKPGSWTTYPASMCWARALSQLCRMLFPDVVLGAGYTPEEIGGGDSAEPLAPATSVPDHLLSIGQAKRALLEACDGDRDLARQVWTEAHMDGEDAIDPVALEDLCARAEELRADNIVDAELVEEAEPSKSLDDLGADWSETDPEAA